MKTLEIHIPISPTPKFFTMVRYFAESLRRNGGAHAQSPVIVHVGEDIHPSDLHAVLPWSKPLGIQWLWADRTKFRKYSFFATGGERFLQPFESDVVMIADADLLVTQPLDDIVEKSGNFQGLTGMTSHVSPFYNRVDHLPSFFWRVLFTHAKLTTPGASREHTTWEVFTPTLPFRYCPPFFNMGVLFAPRDVMTAIGECYYADVDTVNEVFNTIYRAQLAISLALHRLQIPSQVMSVDYNFPTCHQMATKHRIEEHTPVIMHYLAAGEINKDRDFINTQTVSALLSRRDLSPVNTYFTDRLREVHQAFAC